MKLRSLSLSCLGLLAVAAPAGAVVGGQPTTLEAHPAYASYGCGATLIAPDRVVTAAHCLAAYQADSFTSVTVNGVAQPVTGYAMHPTWRQRNANNFVNDVAIMQLAAPVAGVTPATLGSDDDHVGELGTIVGSGRSTAPGVKGPGDGFGGGLHEAQLRVMTDAECARTFGRGKGNDGETFLPRSSFCAIDEDGKAPLSSGCNGDSGGPLFVGPSAAPVLLGVVSYGGLRCGADHLPSVFAEVDRVRAFLTDPSPTWAPRTTTPARITGARRAGGTLTCTVPTVPAGAKAEVAWKRFASRGRSGTVVGHAATIRVRKADRGARLACVATVSNRGGFTLVPDGPGAIVKIAR